MMKPSHCTQRQMHLELDSALPYYKLELIQAAQETKHQTTAYSEPSHLPARAEKRYSNIETEALGILHGLCERG